MADLKTRLKDVDFLMGLGMVCAIVSMLVVYGHHIEAEREGRVKAMENAYTLAGEDPVSKELRAGRDGDCEKVVKLLVDDGFSMLMNNEPVEPSRAAIESACHSRTKLLTYWKTPL